jgi:hypothetical protein
MWEQTNMIFVNKPNHELLPAVATADHMAVLLIVE